MSRIKDQYLAGIAVLIIPKKRNFLGNWSRIKDSTSVFSFTDLKTIQVKRPQQAWNQNPQQNVSFSYKISGSLFFHFYFPLDKTLGSKGYNYSHIKPGYNLPIRDLLYHICNFPFISITPYSFILCAWQRRTATKDQQLHRSVWTVEKPGRKRTESGFLVWKLTGHSLSQT